MSELIDKQATEEFIESYKEKYEGIDEPFEMGVMYGLELACGAVWMMPSAEPFYNITMNDVLKYIDGMPEDVWQEFTACLECRGWYLQRRTAKWCGGDFA